MASGQAGKSLAKAGLRRRDAARVQLRLPLLDLAHLGKDLTLAKEAIEDCVRYVNNKRGAETTEIALYVRGRIETLNRMLNNAPRAK